MKKPSWILFCIVILFLVAVSLFLENQQVQKKLLNIQEKNCNEALKIGKLNYTNLQITQEEYLNLSCERRKGWVEGACYPPECHIPNPPVCTSYYMVKCYDEQTQIYFDNIYLKK